MVRFGFPPEATPEQIAEALKKAYAEIMARNNSAPARADGEATTLSEDTSAST